MNSNAKEITKIPPPNEQDLEKLASFWEKMPKAQALEKSVFAGRVGVVPHSMRPAKSMRPATWGVGRREIQK